MNQIIKNKTQKECTFCKILAEKKEVLSENDNFFTKWDNFPVNTGHILVIPKRHIASFFELVDTEIKSLFRAIARAKQIVEFEFQPAGYNIGVNDGQAAGQTIFHLHIHLIPRFKGDVADPEGGIRNIIPGKGKYSVDI